MLNKSQGFSPPAPMYQTQKLTSCKNGIKIIRDSEEPLQISLRVKRNLILNITARLEHLQASLA